MQTHQVVSEKTTTQATFPQERPCLRHLLDTALGCRSWKSTAPQKAARRRQQRLHSWLRHERMTVAVALAEKLHHTSRGRMPGLGKWGREMKFTATIRDPPSPHPPTTPQLPRRKARRGGGRGGRPGSATDLRRRAGLSGTLVTTSTRSIPTFRFSTCLCRRWGIRWWKFDVPSAEQVIAMHKISFDRVPQCSAVRRPQKAEQLVEVPTEPGYALAVIATNALGWRAAAALAEQIVDNRVPQGRRGEGRGVAEVFKVLVQDRIQQQRAWSRSLIFQLAEVFKVFSQASVPQLPHRVDCMTTQMKEFNGFFALFPGPPKSAKDSRQSSARVLGSVSSSKLSAHQMAPAGESDEPWEDAFEPLRRLRRCSPVLHRRRDGHPSQRQRQVFRRACLLVHRQSDGHSSCSCVTGNVVQTAQKTVVIPVTVLVQFLGAVDMPVVVQRVSCVQQLTLEQNRPSELLGDHPQRPTMLGLIPAPSTDSSHTWLGGGGATASSPEAH